MQIKIKRIDTSLPLPAYQTTGAVAFDLYSRIDEIVPAGKTVLLPTNFIIHTPPGYMLLLAARSSLAKKKRLKMANGVGIIDQDYCGDEDELQLLLHNYTDQDVPITRGERLAQGIFVKIEKGEWQEVEQMNILSRGGFGTTG
jgi:dUTP pyrophosphatase